MAQTFNPPYGVAQPYDVSTQGVLRNPFGLGGPSAGGGGGSQGPQGAQGPPGTTGAIGPGYLATSATSLAVVATGSVAFTTQSGLAYSVGARIRATSTGSGAWMEGVVTAYSGTTLTATMDKSSGTGTHTDWDINVAGEPGVGGGSSVAAIRAITALRAY